MDWKTKTPLLAGSPPPPDVLSGPSAGLSLRGASPLRDLPRSACSLVLSMALVASAVLAPQIVQPQMADAAELWAGQWQTAPTATYLKLAKRIDTALAAQDPKPKVKTTKSKRTKTITATVICRAKKAGIQNAKNKRSCAYGSMVMKLFVPSLYRNQISANCVNAKKTVHGVNNYGKDRASDYSLNVGRDGTADIFVRYEGLLCTYKNGTFRKANYESEVYFNQTRRIKVASVEVPQGYRLKLQLKKA